MSEKPGRNDPCPCGSGKKYKACHMKENQPGIRKKIKATLLSEKKPIDLMERTFGAAIAKAKQQEHPPLAPEEVKEIEQGPLPL